jgi:hypothetical protein
VLRMEIYRAGRRSLREMKFDVCRQNVRIALIALKLQLSRQRSIVNASWPTRYLIASTEVELQICDEVFSQGWITWSCFWSKT